MTNFLVLFLFLWRGILCLPLNNTKRIYDGKDYYESNTIFAPSQRFVYQVEDKIPSGMIDNINLIHQGMDQNYPPLRRSPDDSDTTTSLSVTTDTPDTTTSPSVTTDTPDTTTSPSVTTDTPDTTTSLSVTTDTPDTTTPPPAPTTTSYVTTPPGMPTVPPGIPTVPTGIPTVPTGIPTPPPAPGNPTVPPNPSSGTRIHVSYILHILFIVTLTMSYCKYSNLIL